jgi:hypothetical protein
MRACAILPFRIHFLERSEFQGMILYLNRQTLETWFFGHTFRNSPGARLQELSCAKRSYSVRASLELLFHRNFPHLRCVANRINVPPKRINAQRMNQA